MSDVYIDMTIAVDLGKVAQRVADNHDDAQFLHILADIHEMHARRDPQHPYAESWKAAAAILRETADKLDKVL